MVKEDTDATWGADGVPAAEEGSPACVCTRHLGELSAFTWGLRGPDGGGGLLATTALSPPVFT